MDPSREQLRLLWLHEYRLGHKATEAARKICSTMGEDVLSYDIASLFTRFKKGDFNIKEKTYPGRSVYVNLELLRQLVEKEPKSTTRHLAEQLKRFHMSVDRYLHKLGNSWKYGVCVPHELSQGQLERRVDACVQLLAFHRN